jgi:peptidoglycan/LPS O-acetylase OafA/YrhL
VYLFFVLSGFLITGILLDSKPKPQYYRRFYIRRALRILPVFYLLLLLLILMPRTGWLEHRDVGWPFIGLSFFYLANVTNLFGVPAQYAALWSLAVEEHFYLVWPTVVCALSRRAAAWCAAVIFIACPMLRTLAIPSCSHPLDTLTGIAIEGGKIRTPPWRARGARAGGGARGRAGLRGAPRDETWRGRDNAGSGSAEHSQW